MNIKDKDIAVRLIERHNRAEQAEERLNELTESWEWMKINVAGKGQKATIDIKRNESFGIYEALKIEVKAEKDYTATLINEL